MYELKRKIHSKDDWGLDSESSGTDTSSDEDTYSQSSSAAILKQRQKNKLIKKKQRRSTSISTTTLLSLPHELLCEIFILSSNPNFPLVCRALSYHFYYCNDYMKTQWLLFRHHGDIQNAFEAGVKFPFFSINMVYRFDTLYQQFKQQQQQQQQKQIEIKNDENRAKNEPNQCNIASTSTSSSTKVIDNSSNDNDNRMTLSYEKKKIPPYLFHHPNQQQSHFELIQLLLQRGASPNKPKGYPIIKSAQLGRKDLIELLILHGADPSIRNNMALRACVARNNKELTLYFLDELDVKPDSETLKVAVQKELWDMVQLLMDHGAVPDMATVNFT
ncbi:hypothetical protein BJ944DRAFT_268483 [Cunninghamella echinulata]|nr:hypothetical protein BJ944DRAFT_268483 [Cunninghamella echinulata]